MEPVVNYDHKTIQMRRGTTAEWRRYGAICIPAEAEICVEFFQEADGSRSGNVGIKVGNGTSSYTSLPYLVTNQNQDDRISDEQIQNWDLTVEKLANLTAAEIAQDNASLGDNVQEALNDLHSRLLAIDPDGGSIEINDITGLEDALASKADKSALEQEIKDRQDGDKALQDQIDALDPDGDRNVDWGEIQNKPSEFPPEAHNQGWDTITGKPADYPPSAHDHAWSEITGKPLEFPPETHGHEIADVNGLQDALDAAGGTPAWDDVTGKPTEFPPEAHTHEQSEVDGLELRLEAIEDSITSGGGFVDAPNDGQLYGRQSEAWAVVPTGGASSWNDLTDKPADFPPSDHAHEIADVNGLQDALDAAGGAPAWDDVTGKPTEFPPEAHNHDGVYQPVGNYIEDADSDGKQYARKDGAWSEVVIPEGGTGSSVHIGEAPPADPQEGQQWMEVPATGDATMWVYDGDKWLQHPSGKDGAPGADGNIADATEQGVIATWDDTSQQWTPEGGVVVDASGNVGIGTDNPGAKFHVSGGGNALHARFSGFPTRGLAILTDSDGTTADNVVIYRGGGSTLSNGQHVFQAGDGTERMRIDANGRVSFKEISIDGGSIWRNVSGTGGIAFSSDNGPEITPLGNNGAQSDAQMNFGRPAHRFKNGYFSGTVTLRSGVAVGSRDFIETLKTLREATKDESTLEGLRDAIGNAVGGLIEKFEAMQSTATQEISDE